MRSFVALPLNVIASVPSWPSMVSLPSPGSHWNVSSPAPRKAVSLPCWPSTKSLPSPPSRMSTPLLPSRVSLPVPPSTVISISAARLPVAEKLVVAAVGVEDELLGRADVDRERRRVEAVEAHARAVGGGGELLGAVAAVDLDGVGAGAALVEVGVVAGVPDHAVVAALAERLVVGVAAGEGVVLVAAEQQVEAALAEQRVVAGLAEQLVVAGAAGEDVVAGAAEQVRAAGSAPLTSLSVIMSLPPRPKTWISEVLATVGVPPTTATAPPLTRIWPAASRLTVMLLSRLSPMTVSTPAAKLAVAAALAGTVVTAQARRRRARRRRAAGAQCDAGSWVLRSSLLLARGLGTRPSDALGGQEIPGIIRGGLTSVVHQRMLGGFHAPALHVGRRINFRHARPRGACRGGARPGAVLVGEQGRAGRRRGAGAERRAGRRRASSSRSTSAASCSTSRCTRRTGTSCRVTGRSGACSRTLPERSTRCWRQAPAPNPMRIGTPNGTVTHLDEYQAYTKRDGDASLRVTLSDLLLQTIDDNNSLAAWECPSHGRCDPIRTVVRFHARAYAASAGGDFFDAGGVAYLEGPSALVATGRVRRRRTPPARCGERRVRRRRRRRRQRHGRRRGDGAQQAASACGSRWAPSTAASCSPSTSASRPRRSTTAAARPPRRRSSRTRSIGTRGR